MLPRRGSRCGRRPSPGGWNERHDARAAGGPTRRDRVPARRHRRVHPGITTNLYDGLEFAGDDGTAELLGVFSVSILHNIVHALFGVGIFLAATPEGARTFLLGAGAIYLVLFLLGILGGADWIPSNDADDWLHLVLGIALIGLGVALTRGRDRSVPTT